MSMFPRQSWAFSPQLLDEMPRYRFTRVPDATRPLEPSRQRLVAHWEHDLASGALRCVWTLNSPP